MPSAPIAAVTSAICNGVASTFPWPIAVEPTARSSPISPAGGIVDCAAPLGPRSVLKPNRSAISTSRSAPSCAPSGAKTELQEWANDVRSEPPQYSPLAFSSFTPSSVAACSIGNVAVRLTTPASSTPASVMILNTDPGGWGADCAMPTSASTSPVRGRTTAIPPKRPASASTAAFWIFGSIVVRTALAALGGNAGELAAAGEQRPARRAGEQHVEFALEPGQPHRRSGRDPAGFELRELFGRRRPDLAGDGRGQRSEVGQPVGSLGEHGAVAGQDRRARRQ